MLVFIFKCVLIIKGLKCECAKGCNLVSSDHAVEPGNSFFVSVQEVCATRPINSSKVFPLSIVYTKQRWLLLYILQIRCSYKDKKGL